MVAPQERKQLSADALFHVVRSGFANLPAPRGEDVDLSLTDTLMSACAMCSRQAPSLLALDKERAAGHSHTIYGIPHVPCDTYRRARLDPVSPTWLRPVFKSVFRPLQRGKAREELVCLDGHDLFALEGPGYCSSTTLPGASCVPRVPRHGSITSAHQLLGAALIPPDVRAVIPLRPAPIGTHDGTDNHDGERKAAQRFVVTRRQDHPPLKFIVTEDSLSAKALPIETRQHPDRHDILGVKEGDQAVLFQQIQAAEHAGRLTYDERHDRAAGGIHRVRFVNEVPLKASNVDLRVHFIESWEIGDPQVRPCSGVTDLRVSTRHVFHLMRGGRARWKIENATFHTLKHQGDNFAHHYGPGEPHLSGVLAMLMMLACLVDQPPQLWCAWFQAVWAKLGSKRLRWERMSALLYDDALASMRQLFEALG